MQLGDISRKSAKSYKMASQKNCTSCGKEISIDTTPRHLFYHNFCSEKCKEKYMYSSGY